MLRRAFLKLLGLGALGAAAPAAKAAPAWRPWRGLASRDGADVTDGAVYRPAYLGPNTYRVPSYAVSGAWTHTAYPVYGPDGKVLYVRHTLRPRGA